MIVLYATFLVVIEIASLATGRPGWTQRSRSLSGLLIWFFVIWLPLHLILEYRSTE